MIASDTQNSYEFSVVSHQLVGVHDPLINRSDLPEQFESVHQLQAIDVNHDGKLDAQDSYSVSFGDRRYAINSEEGLKILNYFANPEILRQRHQSLAISQNTSTHPLSLTEGIRHVFEDYNTFSEEEISGINSTPSAWFMDGHIDPRLLTGERRFTDTENAEWRERPHWNSVTNFLRWNVTRGGAHLWSASYAGWETFRKVFIIGNLFPALAGAVGGVAGIAGGEGLIWNLFTHNYTASEIGVLVFRPRNDRAIHQLSSNSANSNRASIQNNIEIIRRRNEAATYDRYFGFTRPFIFGVALLDGTSRGWMWHTLRHPFNFEQKSIIGFFGRMFVRDIPRAFGGGAGNMLLGAAITAAAAYGLYQFTRGWFRYYTGFYAPLEYRSVENKATSAASSVFCTAWLLTAASKQLAAVAAEVARQSAVMTQVSGALTLSNLINLRRVERNAQVAETLVHFGRSIPLVQGYNFLGRYIPICERSSQFVINRAFYKSLLTYASRGVKVGAIYALGAAAVFGALYFGAHQLGLIEED
ncbi:MAG: hypothetical protein HQM15_01480 [Deltaproteobacteria bacterium]|nr:hypothetical protein [Deltaproteobacteria bacterium]